MHFYLLSSISEANKNATHKRYTKLKNPQKNINYKTAIFKLTGRIEINAYLSNNLNACAAVEKIHPLLSCQKMSRRQLFSACNLHTHHKMPANLTHWTFKARGATK